MTELIAVKALQHATANKYAIPAFNVYNIETINAIIAAAEGLSSPVILALSPSSIAHIGKRIIKALAKDKSWRGSVPIIMHLDHGHDPSFVKECIDMGFDSVMIDMSTKDLQTNIDQTAQIVDYAKQRGSVAVEAELGCVSGFNAGTKTVVENDWYTDPYIASDFVAKTKVDFLAVAIGTQHGPYTTLPQLDITRLKQIKQEVSVPLVLHGASGLIASQINDVIKSGISKINIATDLKVAFTNAMKEFLEANPKTNDLRKYLGVGSQAVTEVAKQKIKLFGSLQKGHLI